MWGAIIFFAVLSVGAAQTNVERCQVYDGELPILTHIEGCVDPPCLLPQLQDAVINLAFVAPWNITDMRTLATAFVSIGPIVMPVPFPLGDDAHTCNFLWNSSCPVSEGQMLIYTLRMFIEPFFPVGTDASVELRIVDENNNGVICIRVRIRVTPPVDSITGDEKNNLLE